MMEQLRYKSIGHLCEDHRGHGEVLFIYHYGDSPTALHLTGTVSDIIDRVLLEFNCEIPDRNRAREVEIFNEVCNYRTLDDGYSITIIDRIDLTIVSPEVVL